MTLLYKPLGLLISVLGGMLASAVFNKVWTAATGQQEAPEATSAEHSTKEVLLAALVQSQQGHLPLGWVCQWRCQLDPVSCPGITRY